MAEAMSKRGTQAVEPGKTRTSLRKSGSKKDAFDKAWSAERRSAVQEYVSLVQSALRLSDWTITVDWTKPAVDALATCTPLGDSRHATVRLSLKFLSLSPKLQSQTLVHELVHCHLFALDDLARSSIEVVASKKAAAMFDVAFNSAVEMTTDALADAFSALLPPLDLPGV